MKCLKVFVAIILTGITLSASAQVVKISAYGQEGIVFGDMAKKEINSPSAGYVEYASAGGLEANFYLKNNLGFGIRWSGTYYERDFETYESDLTGLLEIDGDPYDLSQIYAFWDLGSDLGISYLLDLSEKWQLEPYFYFGFRLLSSPASSVIYTQNATTFHYRAKPQLYVGVSYSPGLKINWNAFQHLGFFASLEYDGNAFLEEDERSMIYSFDSLDITDMEKQYSIHSVYLGLGLSFRFGKGLDTSVE
jgi:hypothetical protein